MGQAKRQKHRCSLCYTFEAHYHAERLKDAFKIKSPKRIGLNFMGETFDKVFKDNCPYIWKEIFDMIKECYWHTFIILTKQPQNIPKDLEFPKNLWLGVTVNGINDVWRINELLKINCGVRFISFEPLYEKIDVDLTGIDWIIIGAQTRPMYRPPFSWVDYLQNKAYKKDIPVFMKNNLGFPKQMLIQEFPEWKK
jgi:protein gp37